MCPRSLDHCPGSYYLGYDVRVPNFRKLPFKLCHVTTHDDRTATRTTWTKTTRTGRPLRDNQKTSEKPAGDDQETTRRPPGNQQETAKRPPGYQLETQETSGDHQETSRTAPGNHQDTSKLLSPSNGGIQTHSGAQRQLLARFGNTRLLVPRSACRIRDTLNRFPQALLRLTSAKTMHCTAPQREPSRVLYKYWDAATKCAA